MRLLSSSAAGLSNLFLAIFILGAFLWGTYEMNRSGARAAQFQQLRQRVLNYVAERADKEKITLDDLQEAGVLSAEDLAFLQDNGITYEAIGAQSPGDALCFVERRGSEERHYFRNGTSDYRRHWASPGDAYQVSNVPSPRSSKERRVTVVERATGKTVIEEDVEVSSIGEAIWSADGRFLAITSHQHDLKLGHQMDCRLLYEFAPQEVRSIELPTELRPDRLLPAQHAGKDVRFFDHLMLVKGWRGHDLIIESHGNGRIGGHGDPAALSFNFIYRFDVHIEDGKAVIARQTRKHSVERPFK
jgi:hypothetical protein